MPDLENALLRGSEVRELLSDVERMRQKVMDLIAAEVLCWDDAAPPRHALSDALYRQAFPKRSA